MPEQTTQAPIDTTVLDFNPEKLENAERVEPQLDDMWGKLRQTQWKNTGRIYCWKITDDTTSPTVGDSAFSFTVPPQWDGARVTWVGAAVTTVSAGSGPISVQIAIGANNILTTAISITDSVKYSWATGTTQPVIDQTLNILRSGDQIDVDIDDIGDGAARGLQIFIALQ